MGEHWSFNGMPDGEPIPGKTYRADCWQYVDLQVRLSPEMKIYFFDIIGPGNSVILAQTIHPNWWRGQILISPQGQENMRAHTEARALLQIEERKAGGEGR